MGRWSSLNDLFRDQVQDLYCAETQLVKALGKLAKAASTRELQEALEEHVQETREHVNRLDAIMEMTGTTSKETNCKGMEGLLHDAKKTLHHNSDATTAVVDAAIIASAQRIEHYEIAAYTTLCAYAKLLDHQEALAFLKQTLQEEETANKTLSQIATHVNLAALEHEGKKTRHARS